MWISDSSLPGQDAAHKRSGSARAVRARNVQRVPVTRIAEIVHERRGITPDTALRLARYFNTSAGFWMNLQTAYDLEVAADKLLPTIEREVRPAAWVASSAVSG